MATKYWLYFSGWWQNTVPIFLTNDKIQDLFLGVWQNTGSIFLAGEKTLALLLTGEKIYTGLTTKYSLFWFLAGDILALQQNTACFDFWLVTKYYPTKIFLVENKLVLALFFGYLQVSILHKCSTTLKATHHYWGHSRVLQVSILHKCSTTLKATHHYWGHSHKSLTSPFTECHAGQNQKSKF